MVGRWGRKGGIRELRTEGWRCTKYCEVFALCISLPIVFETSQDKEMQIRLGIEKSTVPKRGI
jgi:hypothetical protein